MTNTARGAFFRTAVGIGGLVLLSAFRKLSAADQDVFMQMITCQSRASRRWLAGQLSWEGRAVIWVAVVRLGRRYAIRN